ncbi:hypothetical protein G6F50_018671 [Rhizopus delemar]|uniref:Uncharacterized protein n=1 Tax=Rhizopus delemar TaxID=936053 RepID=A0A9P6XLX6_9FUNG|nr:hypothetical protein G6F50_018671 [Rhizopus delemar]
MLDSTVRTARARPAHVVSARPADGWGNTGKSRQTAGNTRPARTPARRVAATAARSLPCRWPGLRRPRPACPSPPCRCW